jgi:glucose/arabinose dehydrogenase
MPVTSKRLSSLVSLIAVIVLPVPAVGCQSAPERGATPSSPSPNRGVQDRPGDRPQARAQVNTVAGGLDTPWEIDFLPDGRALITERPGRVRLLSRTRKLRDRPIAEIPVAAIGEGGLMGLAVDPEFRRNQYIYLYRSTRDDVEILRYRFDGDRLSDGTKVLSGISVGHRHVSGRLRFGPDKRLYITTGDAARSRLAQDRRSLNGKTLRLEPEAYRGRGGQAEVFTVGHRNGQGLDWQPRTGTLFEVEHGPIGNDEVNILVKGRNYGWPIAQGREQRRPFTRPFVLFEDTIAPSGASFVTRPGSAWTGNLLIAALRGEHLRRLSFNGRRVVANEALYKGRFGRLRMVREGPDGALYVLTSNREPGRGATQAPADDRVLRIFPPRG